MTDWKQLAAAIAPDIPEDQIERLSPLLDSLRTQLHALDAPSGSAFAVVFRPMEDE